jgi:hypothetical protein
MLHIPQLLLSVVTFVQTPLQLVCPVRQVNTHVPAAQLAVPPVGATQRWLHVPQLLASLARFTHPLTGHRVRLGEHAGHMLAVQLVIAGHLMAHPPQLSASFVSLTHTLVHEARPGEQRGQTPFIHVAPMGQWTPQATDGGAAPQLFASVFGSMHTLLHMTSPVEQTHAPD